MLKSSKVMSDVVPLSLIGSGIFARLVGTASESRVSNAVSDGSK